MPGALHTFTSGTTSISGYLAKPAAVGGPGVLVLQEWWGLVPHIQTICDRLAAEGFVAFAPDLYHGTSTTSPDEAGKLMMSLRIDQAEADLKAAVAGLLAMPETNGFPKVGSVGFCMGGLLSLYSACQNPAIGACVVFYGGFPGVAPDLARLEAPVLGLYAAKDTFVTVEMVHQLEADLTRLGKAHEFHIYPEADHAFFNDSRPQVFRAEDARDAWHRVLRFYREALFPTA
ncbi:MAG: dienelactone hydrolase family protein [Blastocatellia bacterium]|nr:dienelactone hydrolase family protein [Blastocatellia bacterium]